MYELNRVGENTYYISCPSKIGIYVGSDGAYLIDSGNDKDAGKKAKKILDQNGWSLKGIINTHSHADHIGGNSYLQQQTGCKVYSSGIESDFTRHPVLEPSFLYGGYPCSDLRHKFLMAQPSTVSEGYPDCFEIIPMGGHSFDMVGVRTPDNVLFIADSVSSETTLEKYGVTFIYDVKEYLSTLDRLESLSASVFVPSHAPVSGDIRPLIELNRKKVLEISEKVIELMEKPVIFEELLSRVFGEYGLAMSFEQYVLVGSTLRSYLSYLKENGSAEAIINDNRLLWRKTV